MSWDVKTTAATTAKRRTLSPAIDEEDPSESKRQILSENVDTVNGSRNEKTDATENDVGAWQVDRSEQPPCSEWYIPSLRTRVSAIYDAWVAEQTAVREMVDVSEDFRRAHFDSHWDPRLTDLQYGANRNIRDLESRTRAAKRSLR